MQFFVVSAGQPNSDYIEENFDEIIISKEFALHSDTKQKGTYFSIEANDVLILKYERHFVAYGLVLERSEDKTKDFSLRVKVQDWILHDEGNSRNGVSRYGIQDATIGGGRYGTVKTIRPNFGIDKVREINEKHPSFDTVYQLYIADKESLEKEGDFFSLHEELFNLLLDKSESDPEFTFVIRDSNNSRMLDQGYWFFGDQTVAISFWTGMDFSEKRPAISFLINPNDHCELIIQTDIYKKFKSFLLVEDYFIKQLGVEKEGNTFKKVYSKFRFVDYKDCLEDFLKNDYKVINRIIDEFEKFNNEEYQFNDSTIQKFPVHEFIFRLNNIFRYRKQNAPGIEIYSTEDEKRADVIKNISIKSYALIQKESLDFGNAKWIFITGENGSGKTMLLRAIGTALGNRTLSPKELSHSDFHVEATLETDGRQILFSRSRNINVRTKRDIVSRGLAMYGPYRLQQTSNLVKPETFRKALSKKGSFESLFEDNSKLLSFDKQLELWTNNLKNNNSIVDSRMSQTIALLPKIIPDLLQVKYYKKKHNKFELKYMVNSLGSDEPMVLNWNELSSGNKSILNLVSDILIRLFYQQPKISDPSELRGIVIIDEIDLHLHPKAQRNLVITLSETFPNIQFIVSTHSPIPLLGAPKNSAIFVVKRDWDRGVYTERVDNKIVFEDMLPNSILSSPIFGFKDLFPISHDKNKKIRTENTFEEIKQNDELKVYLKVIAQNLRENK